MPIEHCVRTKIDIAGVGDAALSVGPGTQHHADVAMRPGRDTDEIFGGCLGVGIPPATHGQNRNVVERVIVAGGIQFRRPPFVVEGAVFPLVEQIVFVFRRPTQRRQAAPPGHGVKPVGDVFGLQAGLCHRVATQCGADNGVLVGPRRLLKLEGAAMPNAAAKGIREAAAIEEHCL